MSSAIAPALLYLLAFSGSMLAGHAYIHVSVICSFDFVISTSIFRHPRVGEGFVWVIAKFIVDK